MLEHTAKLISFVNDGIENGDSICFRFLDLTKAFDCVSHRSFIDKLKLYGFEADSVEFMKSYLTNGQQFVFCNNVKSNLIKIKQGVPQG